MDQAGSASHQNCCLRNSNSPAGLACPLNLNPDVLRDLSAAESSSHATTIADEYCRDVALNGTSPPGIGLRPIYQLLNTLRI
jgi:hypothetical protein